MITAIEAINTLRTKPDSADAAPDDVRQGFHRFIATARPLWGCDRLSNGSYLNPFVDDWWHVWRAAKADQS
jgi:hypothetical protein